MHNEIEAKFFIESKDKIRDELKKIELNLKEPEFLMKRKCYGIKDSARYFRVRQECSKIVMTCKEIMGKGINDTFEVEIEVSNFDNACEILSKTGLPLKSYQENYRETWSNEEVEVMIDEWPCLQPYIEIEANNEEIVKKYAKLLNLNYEKEAYFGAVAVLYNKQHGISEKDVNNIPIFTFDNKELCDILNRKKL